MKHLKLLTLSLAFLAITVTCFAEEDGRLMKLSPVKGGIKVESLNGEQGYAFLWFYEWHMFDAVKKEAHSKGLSHWEWSFGPEGDTAEVSSKWLNFEVKANEEDADLTLKIRNISEHDWPQIAGIIPCMHPGRAGIGQRNPAFTDDTHESTWFLAEKGLELIKGTSSREIHFNHELKEALTEWGENTGNGGKFKFSFKWPTSTRDAYAGFMVRESSDKQWVMGIAWDSFLAAQGHNPLKCMHLSIQVGPLKKGEEKTIKGKIYLFTGTKEDCLQRYKKDWIE